MFRPHELTTDLERRMYLFLFLLTFGNVCAFQSWTSLYTNYAIEVVGLTGEQMGYVQSVREIPGLLGVGVIALLFLWREQTIAAAATMVLGLGVLLTGFFPHYGGVLLCTLTMSFGFHYYEAVNQSLILQTYDTRVAPLIIGRLRGLTAGGNVLVGLCILATAGILDFRSMFAVMGSLALLTGLWCLFHSPDASSLPVQRREMILRRRYWLFYALTFLAGGRRQIFMIFSLILLVERFHYSVVSITILFLINNIINWFLNPCIGKAINRWGEQRLLTVEYGAAILIFLGYAATDSHMVAGALYIVDQLTFNFSMAVRTFFQKIADPADIAPSMSVGVTINHIAAVAVPAAGGLLWMLDYRIPFWLGAGLAVISLFLVQVIARQLAPADATGTR